MKQDQVLKIVKEISNGDTKTEHLLLSLYRKSDDLDNSFDGRIALMKLQNLPLTEEEMHTLLHDENLCSGCPQKAYDTMWTLHVGHLSLSAIVGIANRKVSIDIPQIIQKAQSDWVK
jgi:hypothetical protein